MNNIVEIKNLGKIYKEFELRDINLSIPRGYIHGIIGPNGAGKTTTLKILMNIISKDSGSFKILDMSYDKKEKEIKNKVGYVGEVQYFYEDKTVNWTGKFISKFYKEWDENLFSSLLLKFRISRTKKIKELSKGMRVKFALAAALSHNPELIILDEPTSGLDPVVRREILNLLNDLIIDHPEKTVILSSHITDDLERIADYISFMINGEIVLTAAKDTLLSDWKKIHYRENAIDASIGKKLYCKETNVFGSSGITNNFSDIQASLEKGIKEENIKIENLKLDDVLITLMDSSREGLI